MQKNDINKLDLAETIFGTERENLTLKGRVQFSHLKSSHITFEAEKNEILGSPQPTYYPNYIRQTNTNESSVNKYITLMDSSATISGYKRYPLHRNIKTSYVSDPDKVDIQTHFKPLKKGSVFHGKIRFHNLKKVEIGALLSALSFHGNSDFSHNIGMAKPLGYGRIKLDLEIKSLNHKMKEYLREYEYLMTLKEKNWIKSEQIKELFSMAYSSVINDGNLKYQKLENEKGNNEFNIDKKNKRYLKNYSNIVNFDSSNIITLTNDKELEEIQIKEQKKQKFQNVLSYLDYDNIQILENFIAKYPEYEKLDEIKAKKDALQAKKDADRYAEIDKKAKNAYEALEKKKGTKTYQKEVDKFIKKWEASKNNKGSVFVLELVEKVK